MTTANWVWSMRRRRSNRFLGALMGLGADERGRFGIDQLLQHHLQRSVDHVLNVQEPDRE